MVNAEDGRGFVDRSPGFMGGAEGMGPEVCWETAELGRDNPDLGRWVFPSYESSPYRDAILEAEVPSSYLVWDAK